MTHRPARIAVSTLAAALLCALPALAGSVSGPAPDFTLPARSGGSVSLDKYKGQVVMINFWASWCGPCRQEMPLLNEIYKQYGRLGFTLIAVNVEPNRSDAEAWLKQTPVNFPVLFDAQSTVSKMYSVAGMPSTVFIDRKGNLRLLHEGYKPGDENEYLNEIRTLVRE